MPKKPCLNSSCWHEARTGFPHSWAGFQLKQCLLAVLLLSCLNAQAQTEEGQKTGAKLQAENQSLKAELAALKTAKESAEQTRQALDAEIARLNSEVIAIRQASASILQIQAERDALTQEKRELVSKLDVLQREKAAQDTSGKQNWFLIGAGVLFGGMLIGVFLPRLNWRKKSSWETF
jgi:SH3 domain protein